MPDHTLFLFPDTNLFIQCKALSELSWLDWQEFSEVHLVVSRPVQREIDKLKNWGNDRVGQRARSTNGLFRKIIESEDGYQVVRNSTPTVKILLGGPGRPNPDLQDLLDYNKPDDEIVGCLHSFLLENPGVDGRVLTHDTGVMATAKTLNLAFVPIKEDWLLEPESNEQERENNRLRQRILQLERAEPQFHIELVDDEGNELERMDIEFKIYRPLSNDELNDLVHQLSIQFPLEDDFDPAEPFQEDNPGGVAGIVGAKRIYTPASEDAISRYTDVHYPNWINGCRSILADLDEALQEGIGRPTFTFAVVNEGTRPGTDALVSLSAHGNIKICPPPYQDAEDEQDKPKVLQLSPPPRPPRGRWSVDTPGLSPIARLLGSQVDLSKGMSALIGLPPSLGGATHPELFQLPMPRNAPRRDPNGFYYKPERPDTPLERFDIECAQWRHQAGQELFGGELFFDEDCEEIRGALRCDVHAQNLSTPIHKTIQVRITITKVSAITYARSLVQELIDSAK